MTTYKRENSSKKKKKVLLVFLFVLVVVFWGVLIIYNSEKKIDYSKYYSEIVMVNKDATLYVYRDNKYIESGTAYSDYIVKLDSLDDDSEGYFKISSMDDEYYIKYCDVEKSDSYYATNTRYKKYIPFNVNIVTKNNAVFYLDGKEVFSVDKSYSLPVIINDDNEYYVEVNDMLLSIKKDDVIEVIDSDNTTLSNTNGIAVLNYHFVYDPNEEVCDQVICHTEKQFREHLSYIKDNGFSTLNMDELEMYIDGKIRLPKSVVITLDDGRNINKATEILEEYALNATAFIVTSRFDVDSDFIKSDYVELQSHSHNLHDVGTCPSGHGQGGGLTCLSDDVILNDLKTSIDELHGATAFCYPFYEYNAHAIELIEKAGFSMAFGGEYEDGQINVKPGINKFKIPRWVMVTYTTMSKFASYLNGGE